MGMQSGFWQSKEAGTHAPPSTLLPLQVLLIHLLKTTKTGATAAPEHTCKEAPKVSPKATPTKDKEEGDGGCNPQATMLNWEQNAPPKKKSIGSDFPRHSVKEFSTPNVWHSTNPNYKHCLPHHYFCIVPPNPPNHCDPPIVHMLLAASSEHQQLLCIVRVSIEVHQVPVAYCTQTLLQSAPLRLANDSACSTVKHLC